MIPHSYTAEQLRAKLMDVDWSGDAGYYLLPNWLRDELMGFLADRSTGPGEQLAKDAVHAYREMQHELHGAPYYALSRQALDELAFAMQKVYRSPVQQEEEAVRRAKAACGATSSASPTVDET